MTLPMDEIKQVFLEARDIPYRIPLNTSESDDACVGKHFFIKDRLEALGYKVRWAECKFSWADLHVPKDILEIKHAEPGLHAWIEVLIDGEWKTLDATWDRALKSILPINDWSQFGSMKPAVPVLEMIPYEEVVVFRHPHPDFDKELSEERLFLQRFNEWLAKVRRSQ